jgi:hypothetical protein
MFNQFRTAPIIIRGCIAHAVIDRDRLRSYDPGKSTS